VEEQFMPAELVRLLNNTAAVIEILGVSVLVSGVLFSMGRYLRHYSHLALKKPLKNGKLHPYL
jgi:hypothetical protein